MATGLMFQLRHPSLEPSDRLALRLDQLGQLALASDHRLELGDPALVELDPGGIVGHTTTFATQRPIPARPTKNR